MLLVLIILGIIVVFLLIIILLLFSTIEIRIKNLIIQSKTENINKNEEHKYLVKISIYAFNKIKIGSFSITNKKIIKINQKLRENKRIRKFKNILPHKIINKQSRKKVLIAIKKMKIKIETMNLKVYVGLEDAMLTSLVTAGIASTVGIIYPHIIEEKNRNYCSFFINPVYQNKNMYYANINATVVVKAIHIIEGIKELY